MSLQLNAEQRNLTSMFTGREQYYIPSYQRPYSWSEELCRQLYEDIAQAYNDQTDYFIGNIILAVSDKERLAPRVVDGQQRLVSVWLLFKAFSLLMPPMKVLDDVLAAYNWDGSTKLMKIISEVFESDDCEALKRLFEAKKEDLENDIVHAYKTQGRVNYAAFKERTWANCLLFYSLLRNFQDYYGEKELTNLLRFILERVYVLPIELNGRSVNEAESDALSIFETLNNRGMNLEDADIFKAKLYDKAISLAEKKRFIERWVKIRSECDDMNVKIDDVFRFYSHILRGKANITKAETKLRDFFILQNSIFTQKDCQGIMDDLERITDILVRYRTLVSEETEVAAWLQLVDVYTNNYPKYAVVTYLFYHGFDDMDALKELLKKVVRYCYFMGSTTTVKFVMYTIIKQIANSQPVDDYYVDSLPLEWFDKLGRLKFGYALLAHYLLTPKGLSSYHTDRLLTTRDLNGLSPDWFRQNIWDHFDDIGNLAIIECSRSLMSYPEKRLKYVLSTEGEINSFLMNNPDGISYDALMDRNKRLKTILREFFLKPQ